MRNITLILLLLLAGCSSQKDYKLIPDVWKFTTGDDLQYSAPSFDDSAWDTLVAGTIWEEQGYPGYDGFAWYRTEIVIPSSLKGNIRRNRGLIIRLAKIDDADETFFNGTLIGSTGKMPPSYESQYDAPREYLIPDDIIIWGETNSIAVRVFDNGGGGGIFSGPIELTVRGFADFITITPRITEDDRIFHGAEDFEIPVEVQSDFDKHVRGTLTINVESDFGQEIMTLKQEIKIAGKSSEVVGFKMSDVSPGFYKVKVTMESDMAVKTCRFNFGYEPEKIISPADPQPDFSEFWEKAKKELATVKPQYKLTKIDSLCTPEHNVFLVEMHSLGDVRIKGWYQVPVKPGKYPAVMQVPGYSSMVNPSYINYGEDIIGFGLNTRGHGNSIDDVNPGFPGYILTDLDNRDKYIYRGAYMDCVRGIDFLFSRPEVDRSNVAVEGASQGGALTFVTAALNNDRIKVCAPQVPFLSDFQHYFKVATWPGNEFVEYVEKENKQSWEEVFKTLSYFDIKNLAPMIKAPLIMGVGLMDEVCPPHINFAAYNNVTSEKEYIAYPDAGHGLPGDFYRARMEFIRKHFTTE